jgi:hypothetical protein
VHFSRREKELQDLINSFSREPTSELLQGSWLHEPPRPLKDILAAAAKISPEEAGGRLSSINVDPDTKAWVTNVTQSVGAEPKYVIVVDWASGADYTATARIEDGKVVDVTHTNFPPPIPLFSPALIAAAKKSIEKRSESPPHPRSAEEEYDEDFYDVWDEEE